MAAPLSRTCAVRLGKNNLKYGLVFSRFGLQTSGIHLTGSRNGSSKEHEDFFGIKEDQQHQEASKVKSGSESDNNAASKRAIEIERQELLRSLQKKKPGQELVWQKEFGQVRLDGTARKSLYEADPKTFMRVVSEKMAQSQTTSSKEAERRPDVLQQSTSKRKQEKKRRNKREKEMLRQAEVKERGDTSHLAATTADMNFFDQQYFGSVNESETTRHWRAPTEGVMTVSDYGMKDDSLLPVTGAPLGERMTDWEPTLNSKSESSMYERSQQSRIQQHQADNFIEEAFLPSESISSYQCETPSSRAVDERHSSAGTQSVSFIDEQYFSAQFQPNVSSESPQFGLNVNPVGKKGEMNFEEIFHHTSPSPHSQSHSQPSFDPHVSDRKNNNLNSDSIKEMFEIPPTDLEHQTINKAVTQDSSAELKQRSTDFAFIDDQYFGTQSHDGLQSSLENAALQYGVQSERAASEQADLGEGTFPGMEDRSGHTPQIQELNTAEDTFGHNPQIHEQARNNSGGQYPQIQKNVMKNITGYPEHTGKPSHSQTPQIEEKANTKMSHDHTPGSLEQGHGSTPQMASERRARVGSRPVQEVEDSAFQEAMTLRRQFRLNLTSDSKRGVGEEEGGETSERGDRFRSRARVFKEQVPDLHTMPSMELCQILADSVVFENEDFIAVSKPYGLPSHGGPGVVLSVGQVLEPLARRLHRGRHHQPDSLHLVHRLDKQTTGVMLLAKNAEVAWQLLGMFRRREVNKVYWTVTKGAPQPPHGLVDIPLARQRIHGVFKTVVKPGQVVKGGELRGRRGGDNDTLSKEAKTEYSVLAQRDSMALVECRPLTGVQHQIRAHLAQALNCPVLGDHKYSHMDRLAPQKLFPEALVKLGIRQAQVRHVPMHLHAKHLTLPAWRGKQNVFISAPLPRFFLKNLKALKINIPPKK